MHKTRDKLHMQTFENVYWQSELVERPFLEPQIAQCQLTWKYTEFTTAE